MDGPQLAILGPGNFGVDVVLLVLALPDFPVIIVVVFELGVVEAGLTHA